VGLTDSHVASAFGAQSVDPVRLRDQADRVQSDLQSAFPRWRRFLGLITPWSWLRSK
jgi:hypothetical protein